MQESSSSSERTTLPYWDAHIHIEYVLEKLKVPLHDFLTWRDEHFKDGFEGCITVCCESKSIVPVTKLLELENDAEHPKLYAAFGMHPHNAKEYTDQLEDQLVAAMSLPRSVAWGECGLDYHYNFSPPEKQKEVFARQLQKAVQLGKPIVIHTREAEEDTLQIMRQCVPADWRVHAHCFTSSTRMAETLLREWSNLYIGFTGVITFGNAQGVREACEAVSLNRILLETDGPFMAPAPHRGKVCHSGYIPLIAKKVSEVKKVSVEEVLTVTRENTKAMYGV